MADTEAFTLLALGLFIIIIRIWARWIQVGPAHFQLDDYLMPLAGIIFTLETVAAYLQMAKWNGLTNSYMTDEQRAALDPDSAEYMNRVWGSKIQVIGWSFYTMILWSLKGCFAIFYSRLTIGLPHMMLRVRIAYVLVGCTYLVPALSIVLGCQPITKNWQINPNPGSLCQPTLSPLSIYSVLVSNIISDVYLLSIPLPLFWKINVSWRRRITLMILFSGAVFVIMAGTIRAVVITTAGSEGAVTGSQWACRETFVAIAVTNLPIIQPLLRRMASQVGLSGIFSRTSRVGQSHPLGSKEAAGTFEMRKSRKVAMEPGVSVAAWGSDEHILAVDDKRREQGNCTGIVVAQEVHVMTEPAVSKDQNANETGWS